MDLISPPRAGRRDPASATPSRGVVVDLRDHRPTAASGTARPGCGTDASALALVRTAREHAARTEAARRLAGQEAVQRSAAVLALHVIYGCSPAEIGDLLGVDEARARSWLREGRRAELDAG